MTRGPRYSPSGLTGARNQLAATAAVLAWLAPVVFSGASLHGATALLQTNADAQTLARFQERVREYVALHKKVEDSLKALPKNATPEQIDTVQKQLSRGISTARAGAKAGDIFEPAMQAWIRQTLERVFKAPDGKQLRASILDEDPVGASIRVNGPYPDQIPLATMPPQVLEALPKLAEELEFRFVGERLILFDHHAHIIVDYVDRALPRV